MASDLCLHPDSVEEVVEDLLNSDIISKERLAKLKDDARKSIDPNMLMDVRHKEVKKESLVETNMNVEQSQLKKIKFEDCSSKTLPKVKDLKIIDKEIAETRRKLVDFQNQRAKRNASLANNILTLEKEKEQITSCPVVVNLDEDQTMHYFNLHLDHLEDTSGLQRGRQKTWKPFQVKPPPVINVITILKEIDLKVTSMKHDEEKLKLLEMCALKPIQVKGKRLEVQAPDSPRPKQEIISIVPNNSPALLVRDSPTKFNEDLDLSNREEIARKVVEKWKQFIKNKKTFELEEKKRKELNLLKHCFTLWILYVKQGKASKLKQVNTKPEASSNQNRTIDVNKAQTISAGIQNLVKALKNQCDKNTRENTVLTKKPLFITRKNHKSEENKLKPLKDNPAKSKVNVRIVKPEDVGLSEKIKEKTCLDNGNVTKGKKLTTETISKIFKEPFENRFLAQQKIIQNQMAVIEKQRKTILELKAEHWATKSKLNLKLAENEVVTAHAAFGKKQAPLIKTIEHNTALKEMIRQREKEIKSKTDLLMERWMERQEYCKQLSELTKMRKKRIEEEKEKDKIEQQEKEKKEKEEQKRLNIINKKKEQQLAKEKERIALSEKLLTAELSKMATKHYNNVLIKKVFKAFKKVSSDVHSTADYCTQMYERKLMGKALAAWILETKKSALIKNQLADKYCCKQLMKKCWNTWLGLHREYKMKVQVSEDMCCLKLQERMFRRWAEFVAERYLENCCKTELAERLHRRQLLRRSFARWRDLPRVMFVQREKEQRRRAWRQAVQELIPDFSPVFAEQLEV